MVAVAKPAVDPLIALFDAADRFVTMVTLFEDLTPGAEYAVRLWASTRPNVSIRVASYVNADGSTFEVVHVDKGYQTFISIHRVEAP